MPKLTCTHANTMPASIYRLIKAALACSILICISTAVKADKISDFKLCADRECQTVISKARTLARHKPRDPAFLAFERGDIIDVYSKAAGNRKDLWGGKINDKFGYFPRSFVREYKVIVPNPEHEIETEHHIPLEERIMGKGKEPPNPSPKPVAESNPPPSSPPTQETIQPQQNEPPPSSAPVQENIQQQHHWEPGEPNQQTQQTNDQQNHDDIQVANVQNSDETELADETDLDHSEKEVVETPEFQTEHKEESVNQKPDTDETEVDETEVLDDATDKEIPTDTGYQTEQSNKQTEGKVIDSQTDVPNDTGNTGVPINSADNAEAQSKYQEDGKPIDSPEDKKVEDQQKTISTKDDEKVVDETDLDDELDETDETDLEDENTEENVDSNFPKEKDDDFILDGEDKKETETLRKKDSDLAHKVQPTEHESRDVKHGIQPDQTESSGMDAKEDTGVADAFETDEIWKDDTEIEEGMKKVKQAVDEEVDDQVAGDEEINHEGFEDKLSEENDTGNTKADGKGTDDAETDGKGAHDNWSENKGPDDKGANDEASHDEQPNNKDLVDKRTEASGTDNETRADETDLAEDSKEEEEGSLFGSMFNDEDEAIINPFGKTEDTTQELMKGSKDNTVKEVQTETENSVDTYTETDETDLDGEDDTEIVQNDREEVAGERAEGQDRVGNGETQKSDETLDNDALMFVDESGEVEGKTAFDGDKGSLTKEIEEMAMNVPPSMEQSTETPDDFPTNGQTDNEKENVDAKKLTEENTISNKADHTEMSDQSENTPIEISTSFQSDILNTDQQHMQTGEMTHSAYEPCHTVIDGTTIPLESCDSSTQPLPLGDIRHTNVIDQTPLYENFQETVQTSFDSTAVPIIREDVPSISTPDLDKATETRSLNQATDIHHTPGLDEISDPSTEETHTDDAVLNTDAGVTIDGTVFPSEYLDDVTPMSQDNIQPTATEDVYVYTSNSERVEKQQSQTSFASGVSEQYRPFNEDDQAVNSQLLDSRVQLEPTSVLDEQLLQDTQQTDRVQILGTSFNYVNPSEDSASTHTVDSVSYGISNESGNQAENVTVASDNVQEQVQPSLDQNQYQGGGFMSRKPLSSGSSFLTGASAEVPNEEGQPLEGQGHVDNINAQSQEEIEAEKKRRENEIRYRKSSQHQRRTEEQQSHQDAEGHHHQQQHAQQQQQHGHQQQQQTEQHAVTDSPLEGSTAIPVSDQTKQPVTENQDSVLNDYATDALYSRKVPDPGLDEEVASKVGLLSIQFYEPKIKAVIDTLPPSLQSVLEQEPLGLSPTITVLVSVLSTTVVLLVSCIACSCRGEKKSGQQEALGIIRGLEEQLFIATKEKENLEDEMQIKDKKIEELESDLYNQQATTGNLESDINSYRDKLTQIDTLKKQMSLLQQEVSDYKHEVRELNTDIKSRTDTIKKLEQAVTNQEKDKEGLQERIYELQEEMAKRNKCYTEKEDELRRSRAQIDNLTQQLELLDTRKNQLEEEAVSWSEKVKELNEQIEQYSTDSRRMQEDLAFKENELDVLRDCFLQVKAFQGEDEDSQETEEHPDIQEKLKSMMDVSRMNAALKAVEEERDILQNRLQIEIDSRKEMEDNIQQLKRKMETNQTDKMKAERQGQEAQTKLEVLSKYFKEKEAELTRQLGEQEVLKNQNISKLKTSDSYTQDLLKENEVYKNQIEDLKNEISKAERDFRSQIAANEKKAHENWLATRAAERELKESRHECGMLRQKLTELERKLIPPGVIRPITHRGMPPPGMLNGPPPPPGPPERPGSRGSVPGHVTPRLREDDYRASPVGPPMDRRLPPGPRPPPPMDPRSPPPYAIRPPFPPGRSPPHFDRYPPPRGPRPPYPRPPPPHLHSPPRIGSPSDFEDSSAGQPHYPRHQPPGNRDRGPTQRHQSQV